MRYLLLIILLFSYSESSCQNEVSPDVCQINYGGKYDYTKCVFLESDKYNVVPREEYPDLFKRILDINGLSFNFPVYDCPGLKNASWSTTTSVSHTQNRKGEIKVLEVNLDRKFYIDSNWITQISSSNDKWVSIGIMCHEIGHMANQHNNLSNNKKESRKYELQADRFAGYTLFKLGATLEQALAYINALPKLSIDINSTHPTTAKRLAQVKSAYVEAQSISIGSVGDRKPSDEVTRVPDLSQPNPNSDYNDQVGNGGYGVYQNAFNQSQIQFGVGNVLTVKDLNNLLMNQYKAKQKFENVDFTVLGYVTNVSNVYGQNIAMIRVEQPQRGVSEIKHTVAPLPVSSRLFFYLSENASNRVDVGELFLFKGKLTFKYGRMKLEDVNIVKSF